MKPTRAQLREAAHYKGWKRVRSPKLDDSKLAARIFADWVHGDGSEMTVNDLDSAVSDFHRWRQYHPGLDAHFRLMPRMQTYAANAERLREFLGTYQWQRNHERRTYSPADAKPVTVRDRRTPKGT